MYQMECNERFMIAFHSHMILKIHYSKITWFCSTYNFSPTVRWKFLSISRAIAMVSDYIGLCGIINDWIHISKEEWCKLIIRNSLQLGFDIYHIRTDNSQATTIFWSWTKYQRLFLYFYSISYIHVLVCPFVIVVWNNYIDQICKKRKHTDINRYIHSWYK